MRFRAPFEAISGLSRLCDRFSQFSSGSVNGDPMIGKTDIPFILLCMSALPVKTATQQCQFYILLRNAAPNWLPNHKQEECRQEHTPKCGNKLKIQMTTNKKTEEALSSFLFQPERCIAFSFPHMLVKTRCMKNVLEFEVRKDDLII